MVVPVSRAIGTRHAAPAPGGPSSSTSSATPAIPAGAAFHTVLAAAKTKASLPSPNSYLDLMPPEPTVVGPVPITLGPTFGLPGGTLPGPSEPGATRPGSLPLGPTFIGGPTPLGPTEVWPGGTAPGPTSTNKAQDPDEPPIGSSPATQAAFYASRAGAYAQSAAEIAKSAQVLAGQVQAEAAVASSYGKTPTQIATALDNAKTGADAAAAAAAAAKYDAFDAGVDAAAAAAAQDDGDYEQAAAEAEAARGAMVAAKGSETDAYSGWGTVLVALNSLSPTPWGNPSDG